MNAQIARAILSEVASGGWLDRELPDNEKELIELAEYYFEEAKLAYDEGMKNSFIHAIINLGRVSVTTSPPVLSAPVEPDSLEGPPGEITYEVPEEVAKTYPRRSSGGYSESDLREVEGLPVPQPVDESVSSDMPVDLTELGDRAARRLYSAFGSHLSRARWKLAAAESNLSNATHLRDEAFRTTYVSEHRDAMLKEEKLSQATLENLAKDTEEYKEWNDRIREHTAEVTRWKALVAIYGGNVERISRDWTMRENEYERSR